MKLDDVPSGENVPDDFHVIIEVPSHSAPVKYETDKSTGAMFVDRFLSTAMHYPYNYGYIPQTLSPDGDPVDVMVIAPAPVITGAVVRCRPLGMLKMADEAGDDAKVLAVPVTAACKLYEEMRDYRDLHALERERIAHFFQHYKDLDEGRWVRVAGWGGLDEARAEILEGVRLFREAAR